MIAYLERQLEVNLIAKHPEVAQQTWHDMTIWFRCDTVPRIIRGMSCLIIAEVLGFWASEPQWPPRTPKPQLANIAKPTLHRRTGHCMTLLGLVKNCYNPKISQTSETCTKVFNLVFQIILGKKVLKQCSSTLNLSMVQCFSESTQLSIQMVLIQDTRMESVNPVHSDQNCRDN